jgi:dethiobiotin synthetase
MNYFITGTDTGVGKTLISCALLHGFAARGKTVVGMKPVACGDGGDVKQLRAAGNVPATSGQINPYFMEQPAAPQLAAQFIGININFSRILESYSELNVISDVVIVEGVGGFRVPLNATQDGADLAKRLQIPLILVVAIRLGCLNHALLTIEAIAARGLTLAGWVANITDPDMKMPKENIELLRNRCTAPLLGVIPFKPEPDAKEISLLLNLALLEQMDE